MTLRERKMREILYERQGRRCNAPCEDYGRGLGVSLRLNLMHRDHIDSKGPDEIENCQLLCSHCNQVKGDRGMAFLLEYHRKEWAQMQLPIFNGSRIGMAKRRQPIEAGKQQPQPQYLGLPVVPPLVL